MKYIKVTAFEDKEYAINIDEIVCIYSVMPGSCRIMFHGTLGIESILVRRDINSILNDIDNIHRLKYMNSINDKHSIWRRNER